MKRKKAIISLVITFCLTLFACENVTPRKTERDFYFYAEGVCFTAGDDADATVDALSKPNSVSVAPSCAGEGCDELYVYNGFRIYTHRDRDICNISAIELTNDTLTTFEGVRIGDIRQRVTEIYGDGVEGSGFVEYVGERSKLRFYMRDGRVSMIKYLEK